MLLALLVVSCVMRPHQSNQTEIPAKTESVVATPPAVPESLTKCISGQGAPGANVVDSYHYAFSDGDTLVFATRSQSITVKSDVPLWSVNGEPLYSMVVRPYVVGSLLLRGSGHIWFALPVRSQSFDGDIGTPYVDSTKAQVGFNQLVTSFASFYSPVWGLIGDDNGLECGTLV